MIEARRRAYLEAMGLDVWLSRSAPAANVTAAGLLQLGPGDGSTLVVCAEPAESAGKFAGDLARALGAEPVWAWPDPAGGSGSTSLAEAIDNRLITRVLLFGDTAAGWLFPPGEVPAAVGSAAIVPLADMQELAVSGSAKQQLWRCLCRGVKTPGEAV
jgi:hypothetical protein